MYFRQSSSLGLHIIEVDCVSWVEKDNIDITVVANYWKYGGRSSLTFQASWLSSCCRYSAIYTRRMVLLLFDALLSLSKGLRVTFLMIFFMAPPLRINITIMMSLLRFQLWSMDSTSVRTDGTIKTLTFDICSWASSKVDLATPFHSCST